MPEFEKRRVFISWSKHPSDEVASALKVLLLHMFDNVDPFVSKENIEAGTLSITEIFKTLAGTDFGILVVTKANQAEPWLNFEAGALAKSIATDGDARVVPLLVDFERVGDLAAGPIANLQALLLTESELRKVIDMMARLLDVKGGTVSARWPAAWERFKRDLDDAKVKLAEAPPVEAAARDEKDMLSEMLELLRGQVRRQDRDFRPTAAQVTNHYLPSGMPNSGQRLVDLGFNEFRVRAGAKGDVTIEFDQELTDDEVSVLSTFVGTEALGVDRRVRAMLLGNGISIVAYPDGRTRQSKIVVN